MAFRWFFEDTSRLWPHRSSPQSNSPEHPWVAAHYLMSDETTMPKLVELILTQSSCYVWSAHWPPAHPWWKRLEWWTSHPCRSPAVLQWFPNISKRWRWLAHLIINKVVRRCRGQSISGQRMIFGTDCMTSCISRRGGFCFWSWPSFLPSHAFFYLLSGVVHCYNYYRVWRFIITRLTE